MLVSILTDPWQTSGFNAAIESVNTVGFPIKAILHLRTVFIFFTNTLNEVVSISSHHESSIEPCQCLCRRLISEMSGLFADRRRMVVPGGLACMWGFQAC